MVKPLVIVLMGLVLSPPAATAQEGDGATKSALQKENFPWYDSGNDGPKPVWPREKESAGDAPGPGAAAYVVGPLVMGLMTMAIAAAVVAILWAFYRFAPLPGLPSTQARTVTSLKARLHDLPADLPSTMDDPWAEAVRLRDAGNLAGSIIALYVYMLLTLHDLGKIRLAPGKTGRQLVRSIADRWTRSRVEPTLRLFESSFYGHHAPSNNAFQLAWEEAEALRRRIREGAIA